MDKAPRDTTGTPRGNRYTGAAFTKQLSLIYVTDAQDRYVREGAAAEGVSMAEWVRRRIFPKDFR